LSIWFGTQHPQNLIEFYGAQQTVCALKGEPNAQDLKQVMDEFASSDNGKMALDDFLDLMERQLLSTMRGEEDLEKNYRKLLQDSFYWLDKDHDGVLTKKEMETALVLCGEKLNESDLTDFFNDFDRNADGKIDYDEWVKGLIECEGEVKC
jgi:Ca2+-binding EF-hand superfamily protein